jgi:Tol biopolymer transport system component
MSAERRIAAQRAPDEQGAEDRAWNVVRSAYAAHRPARRRQPFTRLLLIPVTLLLIGLIALTPAGAAVRRWIDRALGAPHPRVALFSLPTAGRVLVSGAGGTWTVAADGAKRHLGPWRQASWSPHGKYVAVVGADELAVVDPAGAVRWRLARPAVHDPRWFSPNGFRIAYLSGSSLRVVAGDSTGDRPLAAPVASVAPAWRPGVEYQLAYVSARGEVVVRDADSGTVAWSRRFAEPIRTLAWSADGSRLLVVTPTDALVYDAAGTLRSRATLSNRAPLIDAALSPDGRTLALTRGASNPHALERGLGGDLIVLSLSGRETQARRVFSGVRLGQLAFSPDGKWLLVSWPAADQWVFVRADGVPRVLAASRIREQFAPTATSRPGLPTLDGWCCTAAGTAG